MNKRRTKAQKQIAHEHYQLGGWFGETKTQVQTRVDSQPQISAQTLYGYDPALINRDLWRTVSMALVILVIEMLMFRFWN